MPKEERVNYAAMWKWACSDPRRILLLLEIAWHRWRAQCRHRRQQRRIDGQIPFVLAVSPTMRCNYNCQGCYSRGQLEDNELSTDELNTLFSEAEDLGIHSIVLTGGEPLLRHDMLDLIARHRRILFFLITNGSLVTPDIACSIVRSANAIPLVSLERSADHTDERRPPGTHEIAVRAFGHLHRAHALFGFVAANMAVNSSQLATDEFIDHMVTLGCAVGFFTE